MRRPLQAALWALFFAAPAPAPAEVLEHTLVKGDTCWALAERFLGDPKRWREIARANPHIGRCDHLKMEPGVVIRIPDGQGGSGGTGSGRGGAAGGGVQGGGDLNGADFGGGQGGQGNGALDGELGGDPSALPRRAPDARVAAMQPEVQARAPMDEGWLQAQTGMDLYRGWRVSTLDDASADLAFSNHTQVRLRANTLVIIYGDTARPVRRQTSAATLDRGTLLSRLDALAGREGFVVTTPTVEATLREGQAMVDVSPEDGTTQVANHEGAPAEVRSKAGGPPVKVEAGTGTVVAQGARPTPPKPLPAPPSWVDEGPLRFVAGPGQGATVTAQWRPTPGATAYRVELARAGGGRGAVALYEAPANVDRFELVGIPEGLYAARISAVRQGLEGRPGRPLGVQIEALPLAADPPLDAQRQMVVAAGTEIPTPPGITCDPARLLTPGPVQLTCADASGRAIPGPSFFVSPVAIALANPGAEPLAPGQPRRVYFRLESGAPGQPPTQPPAGFGVTATGGEAQGLILEPTGVWGVTVTPSAQAKSVQLEITADAGDPQSPRLAQLDLPIRDPAAAQPEESIQVRQPELALAPVVPEAPLIHDPAPMARLGSPRALPVLDDAQRDLRVWVASASLPQQDGVAEALLAFGIRDHLLPSHRLRLEAGHVRVLRANLTTATPADRAGTWLGQAWRLGDAAPFSALVGVEEWIGDGVQIRPYLSGSWRPGHDLVLRTRQGGSVGVTVSEWAYLSGYGLDYTLLYSLSAGLQGTVTAGQRQGEDIGEIIAGPSIGLHLDWLSLVTALQLPLSGGGDPLLMFSVELMP